MMNNESIDDKQVGGNEAWETVGDVPFSGEEDWAGELHDEMEKREEALSQYRAKSEAFRMDFNERATGPEQFEEWIRTGEEGISVEEIEYEGKKIKVYHLTGHKFLALVHTIDYRGSKADKIVNPEVYKKSRAIRENPGAWVTTPKENNPENVSNGLAKSPTANNVSSSLVSDEVPEGSWGDDEKAIYYGFSNLGLRGIIASGRGDRGVHQGWTSEITDEKDVREINTIDDIEKANTVNEVAFDRYDEDNGRPILPDFIYCPNGTTTVDDLTDDQKRHAAYFDVPIVIMHMDAYKKEQNE
jgi:hypothetical protein